MNYRSISLNGTKKYQYSLVRYTNENRKHIQILRAINPNIAYAIENYSKTFTENVDLQSYFIIRDGYFLVGGIIVDAGYNEEFHADIYVIEQNFDNEIEMYELFDQLVDSLCLYFYDKKNLMIKVDRNIDLSQYNKNKYIKSYRVWSDQDKYMTYDFDNKENYYLMSYMINEISMVRDYLIKNEINFDEKINLRNWKDLNLLYDKDLIEKSKNGNVSLKELFYKAESLVISYIDEVGSSIKIEYKNDGMINFKKQPKNLNEQGYEFLYNVTNDYFSFKFIFDEQNEFKTEESFLTSKVLEEYPDIVNFISNVKDEISVPHLRESIENLISKTRKKFNQRILKKDNITKIGE